MSIFSYHLVKLRLLAAVRLMLFPISAKNTKGLVHAETMSAMVLGSPVYSGSRFFNRQIVVFAQWENESDLNDFLQVNTIGKQLFNGWHIRLTFLRQWGSISGFEIPKKGTEVADENTPVVAVTIARMRYTQIPRFLRWGRPVEKQVRDNTDTKMSLASIRYPNIISTFSIWNSQKAMSAMVHGHSQMPDPKRHHNAMKERERKDFHFEFTTLRFLSLGEFKNGKSC
ncbi:MAG: hypothetical protein ACKOWX_08185 [Flavobacteriales bacterium]